MTSPWSSLPAMTLDAAERFADDPAVIGRDEVVTYAELFRRAHEFGAALVAQGIEPGDRVAIWAPNSLEWIVAVLGIHQAGATLIPVNTRFKGREAADLLLRGRVRLLVTVTDFLDTDYVELLQASGVVLPDLRTIVVADGPARPGTFAWTEFVGRGSSADLAEVDERRGRLHAESPADILFTSGTTGVPKGVLSNHAQTMAVATDWVTMTGLRHDDRYLMVNPYFHMFGLKAGILTSISVGATMVPMPVLDVDAALARVQECGITVFPGPPTLFQMILDHPQRAAYDLSTLRVAVTGAADIPVDLIRRIYAELPYQVVVSGYGMTEAGTASSTLHDDTPETIATTVGLPRPGFEIRISDASGDEAAVGVVGEIVVRGPSVMTGYIDDPDATAVVLSADGWLRTGDLGLRVAAGRLHIVGRTKDMYIVGGFNAYPAEIEAIMSHHPAVSAVAVVGVPDDRLGEVGMAFIATSAPVSESDVLAWCRDNMANYKVPRFVRFVDAIPLNASGKVHKSVLREWATSSAGTETKEME